MKKKIFVLLTLVFLITGCTPKAYYDLDSSKTKINLSFTFKTTMTKKQIENIINYYGYKSSTGYTINIDKKKNSIYDISIDSKSFSLASYFSDTSNIANKCYNVVSYSYDADEKRNYIGTSTGFKCMTYDYLESDGVEITLHTKYKVYKSNADSSSLGSYTWKINSANASKSSILFVYSTTELSWFYEFQFLFYGALIILVIFAIIYIVRFLFKFQSNKVNKF